MFFQQIATQIAVLIAKVARLDCPRQWPELIPILLESVKGQDGLQQHRALLTFYHVTKTLASKRLAQDRRLFQDVSWQLNLFHRCFVTALSSSSVRLYFVSVFVTLSYSVSLCAPGYKVTLGQQVKKLNFAAFAVCPHFSLPVFCSLTLSHCFLISFHA